MDHPEKDILSVVPILTAAVSPEIQRAAIVRYFTANAGFRHPLCAVKPGPTSREDIIGVHQWYRILSPRIDITVRGVVYDETRRILFVNVVQIFRPRFSPFQPSRARLLVCLTLHEEHGRYYIAMQEDYYHPDDFISLIIPPLVPFFRFMLFVSAFAAIFCAKIAQVFGVWRVNKNVRMVAKGHGSTGINGSAHLKGE